MKKSLFFLTLITAVGAAALQISPLPVFAADTSAQMASRAAIVALYQKNDRAIESKNLAAMFAPLAPDYRMTTAQGKTYNRAQWMAMMKQAVGGSASGIKLDFKRVATRILSIKWSGKDAIFTAETIANGTARVGSRKLIIKQVNNGRDYWRPTAQGWKNYKSVETKSYTWLDGKRIQ